MLRLLLRILKRPLRNRTSKLFIVLSVVIIYGAIGFSYLEDKPLSDGLWWSIVSMTTVGYGDLYPTTNVGRYLIGLPTMLFGCLILAETLGVIANSIIEKEARKRKGMNKLKLHDHVIIARMPSVTKILQLVEEVRADETTKSTAVVIIDQHIEEIPEELFSQDVFFVRGNPQEITVLERASFKSARSAIVLASDDKTLSDLENLAIVLSIEAAAPELHTIAEVLNPSSIPSFRTAGCDSVICLSDISSQMIVQEMQDPGMGAVVKELTSNTSGHQMYMIDIPESFQNYRDLRKHFDEKHPLLLGVRRTNPEQTSFETVWNPKGDYRISQNDKAIFLSSLRPEFD